jgi:UDP-N-acetylmuramoyl-tripeptide--D-alanyl-D-alanine ligase
LITNIGLAHLEGFGSAEGVKIGKSELMDHLSNQGGVQFINLREESLRFLSKSTENQIYLGNENNESLILHDDQDNLNLGFIYKDKLYETQLFGAHNFNKHFVCL